MEIVKKRKKNLIHKLNVKKENFSETFNLIRYNINFEAVLTAKF